MDSFILTRKYITAISLLLSISFVCHAEQTDIFFDHQIVPTVLSAAKLPQLQTKAPATITVIDRELINASGATKVSDIFRLVPGMLVGNSRGNFPVVAYQGLTSEFSKGVQVVIDGSSVYSPLFGGVIWSTLPITLEDIERIEIVRGPNSVSFGANAFQSVINITTTHASQPKGTTVSLTKGSQGLERTFARYAGSLKDKNIDYRTSLTNTQTYGYSDQNDDFSKQMFSTRIDYSPNSYNQWQLSLSALDSTRQSQHPDATSPLLIFDPKRDRNESSQYAQLKWGYSADDFQSFNSQLSYHHFDGKDKYIVPIIGELDITGESTRWNADFEHTIQLNINNRAIWGLGAVHEIIYSPFRLNTQDTRSNTRLRLFGNLETQLSSDISLNMGALYEHSRISNGNVSPRLALNYSPSDQHGYRVVATRAFRTPVITEEYRSSFIGVWWR
jgi:iron complex outermembrane receptor protein